MMAGHQICQQFSSKLPKKKKKLMLESPQKGWHITYSQKQDFNTVTD